MWSQDELLHVCNYYYIQYTAEVASLQKGPRKNATHSVPMLQVKCHSPYSFAALEHSAEPSKDTICVSADKSS